MIEESRLGEEVKESIWETLRAMWGKQKMVREETIRLLQQVSWWWFSTHNSSPQKRYSLSHRILIEFHCGRQCFRSPTLKTSSRNLNPGWVSQEYLFLNASLAFFAKWPCGGPQIPSDPNPTLIPCSCPEQWWRGPCAGEFRTFSASKSFSFSFLRHKANMPASKHKRQLTTWQVFPCRAGGCKLECRLSHIMHYHFSQVLKVRRLMR